MLVTDSSFLVSVLLFFSLHICGLVLSVFNIKPQSLVCPLPFLVSALLSHLQHHFFFLHDSWIVGLGILKGIILQNAFQVQWVCDITVFGRPIILNGFLLWLVFLIHCRFVILCLVFLMLHVLCNTSVAGW